MVLVWPVHFVVYVGRSNLVSVKDLNFCKLLMSLVGSLLRFSSSLSAFANTSYRLHELISKSISRRLMCTHQLTMSTEVLSVLVLSGHILRQEFMGAISFIELSALAFLTRFAESLVVVCSEHQLLQMSGRRGFIVLSYCNTCYSLSTFSGRCWGRGRFKSRPPGIIAHD